MSDPHSAQNFLSWFRARVAESPRGVQSRIAEMLEKDRAIVTRYLKGEQLPTEDDVKLIKEFFGEGEKSTGELREVQIGGGVPVVGRIGENVWAKATLPQATIRPILVGAVELEYPIEHQKAFTLEEDTPDGKYLKGDLIFTVSFGDYRARPLPGDIVVVTTVQAEFERFTLRRAHSTDAGIGLSSLSNTGMLPVPPAKNETVSRLVIGFYRPHRKT